MIAPYHCWFLKNGETYGYDASRIALIGGSAGAHLALLASYGWEKNEAKNDSAGLPGSRNRVKAVVDIYGPVDFTTEYARNHPSVTSFLANTFEEAPELFLEASPVHYLDKDDPPTMDIVQRVNDFCQLKMTEFFEQYLN
ncbi:MAG: alpha/beta hydrolase [Bacteroidales bacterium]|nr:alpha/beta hydrolase [Bacteroidales bacterium]